MIPTRSLVPLLALALLFTALLASCNQETGEKVPPAALPAVAVKVVAAAESTPIRQIEVMATVQAVDSAQIAARVSGNITEMPVAPGSRVKEGDLLLSIGAAEIAAKLLQAQAQLEQAERNLERERNLLKKNAATPEMVKTLEESRRIAEAAYREARTMLDYTSITAPFDGVITRKTANIGDLATPGKPLLTLENESRLQVIADIPEALVLGLTIGDPLPVFIPAAERRLDGIVTEIAPSADPETRTAPVKLSIPSEELIRTGQFARVSLPTTRGTAVMVPVKAVQPFGQMDRVFLVNADSARLQLVKTGLRHEDRIEILAGIDPGDLVVVESESPLTDGRAVTVK